MSVTLDRVPVDRITARAREVRFWRTVLTLIAGLLFGLGWLAAKTLSVAWLAVMWAAVAAAEGWKAGRPPPPRR